MRTSSYHVVSAINLSNLMDKVNAKLMSGWVTLGSPSKDDTGYWYQAMLWVREE